ncbi:MAG TPA: threonylcarbamoyl-AMP synthase [Firmicutes bacterium]|jgi:L-threonylcarbamoyladenylate synthase|nr:threonylcarbamoyl-AMP synthase [Bacillota bacterium]
MQWPQVRGTLLLSPHSDRLEEKALMLAASFLREGKLVAFPTETVYGLGANALNPLAVSQIFKAKGRPADNPLIVHIAGIEQAFALAREVPPEARLLARYFWPGPLTMVLPKHQNIPNITTAGLSSVALRVPSHPLALRLIREAGIPIAAPSANISGSPSPTTAAHVLADLAGHIDAVLDGGHCSVGLESTVVSLLSSPPALLRPGWVTRGMLEDILKKKVMDFSALHMDEQSPGPVLSPGMKYRHYAPQAPLFLVEGEGEPQRRQLMALAEGFVMQGRRLGLLLFEESKSYFSAPVKVVLGSRSDPAAVARRLFYALRKLDFLGVDVIVAEGLEEKDLGKAIMNRLRKAALKIMRPDGKGGFLWVKG